MASSGKKRKPSLDVVVTKIEPPLYTRFALQVTHFRSTYIKVEKDLSSSVGAAYHAGNKSHLATFNQVLTEFSNILEHFEQMKVEVKNLTSEFKVVSDSNAMLHEKTESLSLENKTLRKNLEALVGPDNGVFNFILFIRTKRISFVHIAQAWMCSVAVISLYKISRS